MAMNIESISARAAKVDVAAAAGRLGRLIIMVPAYLLASVGWLAGATVYAVVWSAAALAEGYSAGRGKQAKT